MGEQPAERPADGQLHGNALGYLLVLSQPSARLALNCPETTIGSSPHLATICLEDPARIQAIHLIIHIDNNHRASLQVVGPSGITLNNSHLQPSPEPVPLNDRDTFSIDQFPFRWEQRWDNHLTDWSRFTSPSKQPQQQQEEEPQTLLLDITPEKHPSPPKLLISPTKNNQQFTFQWDQESNVSFRRRPRNSIDTHRSRAHSPTDADQSSEDEEEEEEEESDELPTTDPSSLPLTGISLQESPQDPPPPSSPQEASPSQPPRLKSLLQNLLIKQAVQVHLAHHPPSTLPDDETPSSSSAAASGFSSSEDEQEDDDPESTDTDDEILQRPAEPADVSMASSPPASPNPTIAPSDAICPSNPVSLPSTLVRPTFDRRSLSPNAQLLSEFQQTGSPTRTSPPKTLVFPLKSSFRRQSYSAHELAAFSSPPPSSSSTSPYPTTPSPSSPSSSSSRAVRLNTQINSRSPSFPVDPHPPSNAEALRNRLRSSARAPASALPSPPPPPPLPPPPVPEPTHLTPAAIPHRIIRTPRSFLIKRRGSLTPLTAPVCDNTLLLLPSQNEEDYQHATLADDNKKRKVRFDRDVFCLEFDQLPEELPLSRQPKRAKVLPEDDQPDPATTKRKGQRRNTVSVDRPRRQSPRLVVPLTAPIEEEELSDLEAPSAPGEGTQACAAAAPVDLSGLSLSNPPSPSPADAAHLPSGPRPPADPRPASLPGPPSSSSVAAEQEGEAKSPARRGSMIDALAARLFSQDPSLMTSHRRRQSEPARLDEVARRLDTLQLSSTGDGVEGADEVGRPGRVRPHSAPAAASSIVPSLPAFSPALVGVKQLFFGSSAAARASFGDGFSALFRRLRGHPPTPPSLSSTSGSDSDSSAHHDDDEDGGGGDDDGGEDEESKKDEEARRAIRPLSPDAMAVPAALERTAPAPAPRRGPGRPKAGPTPALAAPDELSGPAAQPTEADRPRRPRGRPPKARLPPPSSAVTSPAPEPAAEPAGRPRGRPPKPRPPPSAPETGPARPLSPDTLPRPRRPARAALPLSAAAQDTLAPPSRPALRPRTRRSPLPPSAS